MAKAGAVGYVRVSTVDQATEGVSLEAQQSKIEAWCHLNDYLLEDVFVDAGLSGGRSDNRPQLQEALKACTNGGALVVYSLSRLARSTSDTLTIADLLQKKDVDLVSLSERIDTTSASGKMIFRMMAVLSEFERDQISERTKNAMQHKKFSGERVGTIPYGYSLADDEVHLVEDKDEQAVLILVKQLRNKRLTLQAIANILTEKGHQPRGKMWYAKTVSNILRQM